jgi:TolB protein
MDQSCKFASIRAAAVFAATVGLQLLLPPAPSRAEESHVSSAEARFLGSARQVSAGMTKAGEGYFSPDGRRIAYQAVPQGYPFYQIYMQDFAADDPGPRPPQRVSTGRGRTTCAWFSPAGERLLFASSHLDPALDATEAAARAQAEDDARTGRRRRYQWDFDPHMDLFVADLATGVLTRLTDAPGYDAECSFSPDGDRILFVSDRDGDPDIYVMDADGGNVRQLTNAPGYDGGPFFSPDGAWIAYRTDRLEKDALQIHVMRADGSGDTAVTAGKGVHWAPFWHPTRPWLIWTGADHSDPTQRPNYDLWIVRYEATAAGFRTTAPVRLTDHPSADVLPAFSPDGTRLLWTSGRGPDGGGRGSASQLWVSHLDLDALDAALAAMPLDSAPHGPEAGVGDGR